MSVIVFSLLFFFFSLSESSCEDDIQVKKHVHPKTETFNSNHDKKTWKQTVCHYSGSEESKTSSKKSHFKAKKEKALSSGLNRKVAKHEVQKSSSELSSEEEEKGLKKKNSTQLTKNENQKNDLSVNLCAKLSSEKEKTKDSAKSKVKKNSKVVISDDSKSLKKNKKEPRKASTKSTSGEEEESSVSSTSGEDLDQLKSKVSLTATEGNNKQAQSSDESSSSSESDSEPTVMPKTSSKLTSAKLGQNEKSLQGKQNLNPVKQASKNKVIERNADSSDESSSSEDSEDELSKNEASSTSNTLITKNQSSSSEEESSDDDDDGDKHDDDDDGVKSKSLTAKVKEGATSKARSNNRLNGTVKEGKNLQKSLHKPQGVCLLYFEMPSSSTVR